MTADEIDTYHIELKPGADPYYRSHGISRAPIYRLRRLLKYAARECGFKVSFARNPPPATPLTDHEIEGPMIRFTDGPAAGQYLVLKRAPLYLRVVYNAITQKFDALDQLVDAPDACEAVFVYRRDGEPGVAHIDFTRGKGKSRSGWFAAAVYNHVATQPDADVLRSTERWRAWCWEQVGGQPKKRAQTDEAATAHRAPAAGVQADGQPLRETPAHADHA